MYQNKKKTNIS